jgi:hypothetical protein
VKICCTHSNPNKTCQTPSAQKWVSCTLIALGALAVLAGVLALIGASHPTGKLGFFAKITKEGAAGVIGGGAALIAIGTYLLCTAKRSVKPEPEKPAPLQPETPALQPEPEKPAPLQPETPALQPDPKALVKKDELSVVELVRDGINQQLPLDPDGQIDLIGGLITVEECFSIFKADTPTALANRALGKDLKGKYGVMRARGRGDCFYLSYTVSLLFLAAEQRENGQKILSNPVLMGFQGAEKLKRALFSVSNPETAEERAEALNKVLVDLPNVQMLANELRAFACDLVKQKMQQDQESWNCFLKFVVPTDTELTNIKSLDEYLAFVRQPENNAKQLEIKALSEILVHINKCNRADESSVLGFQTELPFAVNLLSSFNHFDALIPLHPKKVEEVKEVTLLSLPADIEELTLDVLWDKVKKFGCDDGSFYYAFEGKRSQEFAIALSYRLREIGIGSERNNKIGNLEHCKFPTRHNPDSPDYGLILSTDQIQEINRQIGAKKKTAPARKVEGVVVKPGEVATGPLVNAAYSFDAAQETVNFRFPAEEKERILGRVLAFWKHHQEKRAKGHYGGSGNTETFEFTLKDGTVITLKSGSCSSEEGVYVRNGTFGFGYGKEYRELMQKLTFPGNYPLPVGVGTGIYVDGVMPMVCKSIDVEDRFVLNLFQAAHTIIDAECSEKLAKKWESKLPQATITDWQKRYNWDGHFEEKVNDYLNHFVA